MENIVDRMCNNLRDTRQHIDHSIAIMIDDRLNNLWHWRMCHKNSDRIHNDYSMEKFYEENLQDFFWSIDLLYPGWHIGTQVESINLYPLDWSHSRHWSLFVHNLQPIEHGKQTFVWNSMVFFSLLYEPDGHWWTQCPSSRRTSLLGWQAIQSVGLGPLHCVHVPWQVWVSPVFISR